MNGFLSHLILAFGCFILGHEIRPRFIFYNLGMHELTFNHHLFLCFNFIIRYVLQSALFLSLDWQLEARTRFWQRNYRGEPVPTPFLTGFQRDLNSVRILSQGLNVRLRYKN